MAEIISSSSGNTLRRDQQTDQVARGGVVVQANQDTTQQSSPVGDSGHSGAAGVGFAPECNPGEAFPGGGRKMGKIGSRLGEA